MRMFKNRIRVIDKKGRVIAKQSNVRRVKINIGRGKRRRR